jgi:hypothetical protein
MRYIRVFILMSVLSLWFDWTVTGNKVMPEGGLDILAFRRVRQNDVNASLIANLEKYGFRPADNPYPWRDGVFYKDENYVIELEKGKIVKVYNAGLWDSLKGMVGTTGAESLIFHDVLGERSLRDFDYYKDSTQALILKGSQVVILNGRRIENIPAPAGYRPMRIAQINTNKELENITHINGVRLEQIPIRELRDKLLEANAVVTRYKISHQAIAGLVSGLINVYEDILASGKYETDEHGNPVILYSVEGNDKFRFSLKFMPRETALIPKGNSSAFGDPYEKYQPLNVIVRNLDRDIGVSLNGLSILEIAKYGYYFSPSAHGPEILLRLFGLIR